MSLREIREKEKRLKCLMRREGLDAVLLTRQDNFAWFTCGGDSHVLTATEGGVASILVTGKKKYILTDNIEAGRIMDEEVRRQGFVSRSSPWHEEKRAEFIHPRPQNRAIHGAVEGWPLSSNVRQTPAFRPEKLIRDIAGKGNVGADGSVPGTRNIAHLIAPLRYSLVKEERERYRWLGRETGECMAAVAKGVRPGMSEFEAAGGLAEALYASGITPIVLLMAADERISKYRHPIPTDKKVKKCLMLVCGARKWGLIVSITRLVHFGTLSRELRRKHEAVVRVDLALNLATRPGRAIGEVFNEGLRVYKETGFAGEWRLHHQGGPTGYAARDFKGTGDEKRKVQVNQAFAWNPSITGTKSEDTVIAMADRTEFVSRTPAWPMVTVEYEGRKYRRPGILVR